MVNDQNHLDLKAANAARKLRSTLISNELSSDKRSILLTAKDAYNMQKKMGGDYKDFYKYFFGNMPMHEAIKAGYKISVQGFFEASHAGAVNQTAKTLIDISQKLQSKQSQNASNNPTLLDLFAGSGISAWAYSKAGFHVTATEADRFTATYAKENIELSRVNNVNILNRDALDFLGEVEKAGQKFTVISLDPPWSGNYDYDLSKPFHLRYTNPSLEILIRKCDILADVLVMNAPRNIDRLELIKLAEELDRTVHFHYYRIPNYPLSENVAYAFLVPNKYTEGSHIFSNIQITPY